MLWFFGRERDWIGILLNILSLFYIDFLPINENRNWKFKYNYWLTIDWMGSWGDEFFTRIMVNWRNAGNYRSAIFYDLKKNPYLKYL